MSADSEFQELPEWLQDMWEHKPSMARIAEKELSALRSRAAELEAAANQMRSTFDALIGSCYTTALTPRNCEACRRGAERMREAAVSMCKDLANRTSIFNGAIDTKRNRAVRGEHIIYENLSVAFRALPLDCGDCNPLKPEA